MQAIITARTIARRSISYCAIASTRGTKIFSSQRFPRKEKYAPRRNCKWSCLPTISTSTLSQSTSAGNCRGKRDVLSHEVVRARNYTVTAKEVGSESADGITVKRWRLGMDNDWTVPAVEMYHSGNSAPVILIGDQGRAALAAEAQRLLSEGKRVVAVDPFYFGESKISKRDFLFALLLSSVGDRPLGVQASQIAAIARWLKTPVTVHAFGPRSSLVASVAGALEGRAITGVETHDALSSLKQVIEKNMKVDEAPELFCFGLLESFDIPQLKPSKPIAQKFYEIHRATSPINIDGKLDEPAWQHAASVGDFGFPWPKEGKKEQTVAKLLWDDNNLYVSWYAHDEHISAAVTQRHGPVSKDDCVEIFISPNPDKVKNYYTFEINAIGTMLNRARTDWWSGPPNWEPEGVQYRTTFHGMPRKDESAEDSHWIVEAAIPLKNFARDAAHTPPQDGDVWRLNLQRLGGSQTLNRVHGRLCPKVSAVSILRKHSVQCDS